MIKKGCLYVARAYTDKCNYLTAIRGKSYLESSPMYYTYVRAHANRLAAKDLLKVVDYL